MTDFAPHSFPGVRAKTESDDRVVAWRGRFGQDQSATRTFVVDGDSRDSGNSPTTTLRAGLVMAVSQTDGRAYPYDPNATDGRQIPVGALESAVDLLENGVAVDRFAQVLVAGLIRESALIGLDPRARQRLSRRFTFDREGAGGELFLGRLAGEKNPQALIQALTKLDDSWRGLYVGRGPMAETLKMMAMALTPGRVQFVDYVHHVGDFYAAADVFLLASDFEGDSLALHEAALAGVPIVTTDVGSVPELTARFGELYAVLPSAMGTIDGQTRSRRHTPDELAEAVLRADSEEFRAGPAMLAEEVRWENFTLPTIAAQWEEYLHAVVEAERLARRRPNSRRIAFAEPMRRAA